MLWFFAALIGYFCLAVVFVLDKLILTKTLEAPVVYTFYSTIFMFALLLAVPFGVGVLALGDWSVAIISGFAFGFALWTMFIAVKREEASRINPFIGAIVAAATFAIAAFVLGESLTLSQVAGVIILFIATFLLSLSGGRTRGHLAGFVWGVLSGVLFAISHTSAKYIYDAYPFITGFVWTKTGIGFVGLICLFFPSVRSTLRRTKSKSIQTCRDCGFAETHAVSIVIMDKILGILGVVFVQYAIAIGSVVMVNALVGIQYAFMIVLIYVLTRYAPKFFKEDFHKGELIAEVFAIALVVAGSALFVI